MPLKESGEMYLETIYVLCNKTPYVRSVDVAEHMNFSRASVSRGMGLLKKQDLITVDKDGYITLTETGKSVAQKIMERHDILTEFLLSLGVDEKTAEEDACRIEHIISDKTFTKIKSFLKKT